MANKNDQNLTQSSQQKLTKYSSDLIQKGLGLAQNLRIKSNYTEIKKQFLTSSRIFAEDCFETSSLSISANGTRLASYSFYSDGIIIWDLKTYEKLKILDGQEPICISHDGNFLACCFLSYDYDNDSELKHSIVIYDINSGSIIKNFGDVTEFFDPDPDYLGYSRAISPLFDKFAWIKHETNEIVIFDLNCSQIKYLIPYQESANDYLTFNSKGKILSVTSYEHKNFYMIDTETGKVLKTLDLKSLGATPPVFLSQDGKVLITQSSSLCGLLFLDIDKEKVISFVSDDSSLDGVTSCCSDWSGKTILKGGWSNGIEVLEYFSIENINNNLDKKNRLVNDLLMLGDFYFNKQDYEEAKRIYTEIIDLDPSNFELYLRCGKSKLLLGDSVNASHDFSRSLMINDKSSESCFYLGFIAQSLCNYQQAIEYYTRCLKINPKHHLAYNQRSSARSAIGDYEGALDDLDQAKLLSQN